MSFPSVIFSLIIMIAWRLFYFRYIGGIHITRSRHRMYPSHDFDRA